MNSEEKHRKTTKVMIKYSPEQNRFKVAAVPISPEENGVVCMKVDVRTCCRTLEVK